MTRLSDLCTAAVLDDGEPDCDTCQNTGTVELECASVTIPLLCPECPRADWAAEDAAAERMADR